MGWKHPQDLSEAEVLRWCVARKHGSTMVANNTVYRRLSTTRTFLRWCEREGHVTHHLAAELGESPLRRSMTRTYGKVQAKYPGRWLSHEEAYGTLVGICQDGTLPGLRDEIVIRLGLMGMRAEEIRTLTIGNLSQLPLITWTGKRYKPRRGTAGKTLVAALRTYLEAYGVAATQDAAVICRLRRGTRSKTLSPIAWGEAVYPSGVYDIVSTRAKAAGLGHVAPHDLRRTTAAILHRSKDTNGAHHFDLRDIQVVLNHESPATTARYLDSMDTDTLDHAAAFLD